MNKKSMKTTILVRLPKNNEKLNDYEENNPKYTEDIQQDAARQEKEHIIALQYSTTFNFTFSSGSNNQISSLNFGYVTESLTNPHNT